MLHIKVDYRECNRQLLAALSLEKKNQLHFCRLPIGDYQVNDFLLVERKTIPDLVASIKDGRWFRQAVKLSNLPMQTLVILEGTSFNCQSIGMKREAVQGALVTLSLLLKIPLLRSRNPEETAKLILYSARQIQTLSARSGPVRRPPFGQKIKAKQKRQIHVLQGFPGIGPARAKLLLEKFGSLKGVLDAFSNEWEETPGIGKGTIRKIMDVME